MGHEEKDWAGLGSWRGVSLGAVKSKRRAALETWRLGESGLPEK